MKKKHFLSLMVFFFIAVIQSQVPAIERNALIAFYNATNGPTWHTNTNWNTAAPVGTWFGITVANGNVVAIDLNITNTAAGTNNLSGNLPDEIGNLQALTLLDLSHNNISGTIPNTILNCFALKALFLQENNLQDEIPNFESLPDFDQFAISNNHFQFGDFETQFPFFNSLSLFTNSSQKKINFLENISTCEKNPIALKTIASGSRNTYQWYKGAFPSGEIIPNQITNQLTFNLAEINDTGLYYCLVNSSIVKDLTLVREQIQLAVNPSDVNANPIDDFFACDDDNDGFADFIIDIKTLESEILGMQTDAEVNYFDEDENPIVLTNPFRNTTANLQTITVKVTTRSCFAQTTFNLMVVPSPEVDTINNQIVCDNFALPDLTNGNYFTKTNGNGSQLNAGDRITTSQTIFIYAQSRDFPECTSESSFTITIANPIVDQLNDVSSCDSIVLEPLANGNYYTQTNGNGELLNAGAIITSSQTLYIFSQAGQAPNLCIAESAFTITITPTITFELTEDNLSLVNQDVTVNIETNQNLEYAIDDGPFKTSNVFLNLSEGIHRIKVKSENGCFEQSITFQINIIRFIAPKFFTPNGDGFHDTWTIIDSENRLATLFIYDRSGKLLKTLNNPSTQFWDGSFNGIELPTNDYWFLGALKNGQQVKGHFLLKR